MSSQLFKSVYFPDLANLSPRRESLKIAFRQEDAVLHESLRGAASLQLRRWLGHDTYASLQKAAVEDNRSINAYCLLRLKDVLKDGPPTHVATARGKARRSSSTSAVSPPDLGLLATFKGGKDEPLHDWFPYLEGYSSLFVQDCLRRYAPDAHRILDPFGGVGTTALTVSKTGLRAYFCEVNPLLQFVFAAKQRSLTIPSPSRAQIADQLDALAGILVRDIARQPAANDLRKAHGAAFGGSLFFPDETFESVLQARQLLDRLECENKLLADLAGVAAVASLVPASLLIRRGDLRFRTKAEMQQTTPSFSALMKERLICMAADLRRIDSMKENAVQVCDDARELYRLPPLAVDAVLTSPPYLNGTNYFRNTKLELWFLRCLKSPADLAAYRYSAITAGINDVTTKKLRTEIPGPAEAVVKALRKDAYDRRIPDMAANYFADMQIVFTGLSRHLRVGGRVILDIGDSSYGGVHVPTERILKEMLLEKGFRLEHDVTLRQRASRGGAPLRQALLVMERRSRTSARVKDDTELPRWWSKNWEGFKKDLPHQTGQFARRNWGHGRHSLCSYQGKMKPSLAHFLVRTFVPDGGTMLDPFAGVGTIPLEAALRGTRSISFDISPTALTIARAKLGNPTLKECLVVLDELGTHLRRARVTKAEVEAASIIRFNGPLPDYFSEATFHSVLQARRYFLEKPPANDSEALVLSCLLHILHGNRPYALSRRSHPITPFAPTGPHEDRALLPRLQDKIVRTLTEALPDNFVRGDVLEQDACGWWPHSIRDLDAVITSPPFFDSTRFYLANWMRLWFSGWELNDFKIRPLGFVDERQKQSFAIYEPIFRQARERLKPGGVLVMHLGKSRKCDMAQILSHVARHWFRVADCFTENVEHCESHGIRDKGTVTSHQYLVLE